MAFLGDLVTKQLEFSTDGSYMYELIYDPSGNELLGLKEVDPKHTQLCFNVSNGEKYWIQDYPTTRGQTVEFNRIIVVRKVGDKWQTDQRYTYLEVPSII